LICIEPGLVAVTIAERPIDVALRVSGLLEPVEILTSQGALRVMFQSVPAMARFWPPSGQASGRADGTREVADP
jgi:hypothetical protein